MEVKRIEKNWYQIGENWHVNLESMFFARFYKFAGFDIYDGSEVFEEVKLREVPAEIQKSIIGLNCEI